MFLTTLTIPATGQTSDAIGLNGLHIARIELPATVVSATLQFEISLDGSVFQPTRDTVGGAYNLTIGANRSIPIPPEITKGGLALRIKTVSVETTGLLVKVAIEQD